MNEYLEILWYLVLCVSVTMYILLDGFDLGVGSLLFLGKSDEERRIMLNTIGPLWDGNEVWLIIVGGVLFAGFPPAYAAICSCYYTLIMILLFGIILRAVGIEFRSKVESPSWRKTWDTVFGVASTIITLGAGLLLGSLVAGIPFTNIEGDVLFEGTFASFITPFTCNIAIIAFFLFAIHGAIFLLIKTEGALQARVKKIAPKLMLAFLIAYFISPLTLQRDAPEMFARYDAHPWLYIFPLFVPLFIYLAYRMIHKERYGWAFIYSCKAIGTIFGLSGISFAPNLLVSSIDPKYNLTLYNVATSSTTLTILLIVVVIGMPLVFAYGIWLYKTFSGKTRLHHTSY